MLQYRLRSSLTLLALFLPAFPTLSSSFFLVFTVAYIHFFQNHRFNTPLGNDINIQQGKKNYDSSGVSTKAVNSNQIVGCQSHTYRLYVFPEMW